MRTRRRPEDAKAHILDIAEQLFASRGRDALTLKEIAAEAGITHSNILHHFGSRGELHKALASQMIRRLVNDIITRLIAAREQSSSDDPEVLHLLYDTLVDQGHARMLIWQIMDTETASGDTFSSALGPLFDQLQAQVMAHAASQNRSITADQANRFIRLAATAAIGEAVIGNTIDRVTAYPDKPAADMPQTPIPQLDQGITDRRAYLQWFADMLNTKTG